MKWTDLYVQKGTYISDEFDIGSNFDSYVDQIEYAYDQNGGTVDVYVRVSLDSVNWSEWTKINDAPLKELFQDQFYNMEFAKFQYKVEMSCHKDMTSPVFQSFKCTMFGSYLIENTGDVICKPEIWIKKTNDGGDVKLTNETNGQILIFTDLNNNEEVYVDCENQDIASSLPSTYRYDSHNDVFLELEVGQNLITGEGDFILTVRHEFKTIQG